MKITQKVLVKFCEEFNKLEGPIHKYYKIAQGSMADDDPPTIITPDQIRFEYRFNSEGKKCWLMNISKAHMVTSGSTETEALEAMIAEQKKILRRWQREARKVKKLRS